MTGQDRATDAVAEMPQEGEAILLRGVGGGYLLEAANGATGIATARGIFRNEGIAPLPGDRVRYGPTGDPDVPYVVEEILPRRNLLPRPAVANLDALLILASVRHPAPDLMLVDKMLILCGVHGIDPVLCITKTDLRPRYAHRLQDMYADAGCPVLLFGQDTDDEADLALLRERIRGRVVAFSGPSGVGKSTLLNRLADNQLMKTGVLSQRIQRGKHTTRHVELFPFGEGYVADTPGFSSLSLQDAGVTGPDVLLGYPEIRRAEGHCRYQGCRHMSEPGCAVADLDGLHPDRLARYRVFRGELDAVDPYARRRSGGSGV